MLKATVDFDCADRIHSAVVGSYAAAISPCAVDGTYGLVEAGIDGRRREPRCAAGGYGAAGRCAGARRCRSPTRASLAS